MGKEGVTEKGGTLSKNGNTICMILLVLSVCQWFLVAYIQFVQYFIVFTTELLYYFNFFGVFGSLSLMVVSFFIFLYLLNAKKGDVKGVRSFLLVMFFVLFIPLILIYIFFAAITIDAIIMCILGDVLVMGTKITSCALGLLGMFITLLLLSPYMIFVKRFSDTIEKKPEPKLEKDGKKNWLWMNILSFFYLLLVIYVAVCHVLYANVNQYAFIFFWLNILTDMSGCVLYCVSTMVSRRVLQANDDGKKVMMLVVHIFQYLFLVSALASCVVGIVFSALGFDPNLNDMEATNDTIATPLLGVLFNSIGIPIVLAISIVNIVFFYLAGKE